MSEKKSFEYIEEKIKLAAENSQPAFDEKAWEAMKVKLDKEEKKRKPFFLWWIAVPLLFGAAWGGYTMLHTTDTKKQPVEIAGAGHQNNPEKKSQPSMPSKQAGTTLVDKTTNVEIPDENNAVHNSGNVMGEDKASAKNVIGESTSAAIKNPVTAGVKNNKGRITIDNTIANNTGKKNAGSKIISKDAGLTAEANGEDKKILFAKKRGKLAANTTGSEIDVKETDATSTSTNGELAVKPTPILSDNALNQRTLNQDTVTPAEQNVTNPVTATSAKKDKTEPADNNKPTVTGNTAIKKTVKEEKNVAKRLYLLATAGTDAGSMQLFSYSKSTITSKYGIGIGYQINKKLSVQTGFYATNKKYVAGPDDYHAKAGSYWSIVQIHQVKAACLVYEIPVTLRYNFVQKPAVTYFGTVGTSSYIMQKEDYDYFYTYYNTPYEKLWRYTGNKHFLSTLTFSAGIEKRLSAQFSVLIEPSFSIPLTGVGDGKVKLYSSSILAGIKYFPFLKRR